MTNLFSEWDKDKLAVATIGHFLTLKINTSICDNYYQLGEKERKLKFPFNFLQKKFKSGPVTPAASTGLPAAAPAAPGLRHKFVNKIFYPTLEYLGLFHNISKVGISEEFRAWVNNYNPDIIYAQAYDPEGVRFLREVQQHFKKPMVFHMMDDWPAPSIKNGLFKSFWSKKIDRDFRLLLDNSSLLLSIGEDMSEEYKRRYGKEFIPFHNPINIDFWKKSQKNEYTLNESPYLLYAGRIGLGIDSSLKLIAEAVEKINTELHLSLKFMLRSDEQPGWINEYPSARFEHFVAYEEVPRMLSEADILMLPYDFSAESIRFIKYSMPTKASEYMMSGTPVILFAPPDTAVVNYAKKYDCFEISTENSVAALSASIKNIITSLPRRRQLSARATSIAEQKHNALLITSNFRKALSSIRQN